MAVLLRNVSNFLDELKFSSMMTRNCTTDMQRRINWGKWTIIRRPWINCTPVREHGSSGSGKILRSIHAMPLSAMWKDLSTWIAAPKNETHNKNSLLSGSDGSAIKVCESFLNWSISILAIGQRCPTGSSIASIVVTGTSAGVFCNGMSNLRSLQNLSSCCEFPSAEILLLEG